MRWILYGSVSCLLVAGAFTCIGTVAKIVFEQTFAGMHAVHAGFVDVVVAAAAIVLGLVGSFIDVVISNREP